MSPNYLALQRQAKAEDHDVQTDRDLLRLKTVFSSIVHPKFIDVRYPGTSDMGRHGHQVEPGTKIALDYRQQRRDTYHICGDGKEIGK